MDDPNTASDRSVNAHASRANTMLAFALAISLVSAILLVLVVLLIPTLISAAAGLFIFAGIPLAVLSAILLLVSTGLLVGAGRASHRFLFMATLVTVVLCWTAIAVIALAVVVCFLVMSA